MNHNSTSKNRGRLLTLNDFDYDFPERLIAQSPCAERDQARLLLRDADGTVRHAHIRDLTLEIPSQALLILNDSRVFPSRLFGHLPTGGRIELFLLEPASPTLPSEELANENVSADIRQERARWRVLARPMRKLKPGTHVQLAGDLIATIVSRSEDASSATATIEFSCTNDLLIQWLERHGYIPLPPYIKRDEAQPACLSPDRERYQTVFASDDKGSVAAPTAGLHFTPQLLQALQNKGVAIRYVRLHVGGGTFLPVKSERLQEHAMHRERTLVPQETLESLLAAKDQGRPVIAVGTTSLRSLEDLYRRANGDAGQMRRLAGCWHETNLFLYPEHECDRYRPWMIDALFTNFHQPKSTLFMLVAALVGLAEAKQLYAEAIDREYRLYSYGDGSLLWL